MSEPFCSSYSVLSRSVQIINDLTEAIRENNLLNIKDFGAIRKTPYKKNEKPNPFDEAVSLIWYLENVFYSTSGYGLLPEKCI
jgi:hypothetical protein